MTLADSPVYAFAPADHVPLSARGSGNGAGKLADCKGNIVLKDRSDATNDAQKVHNKGGKRRNKQL